MLSLIPLIFFSSLSYASPLSPQAAQAGAVAAGGAAGKPTSEGATTFDGQNLANIQAAPAPAAVMATAISQNGWTATADSQQDGNAASSAVDGSTTTFWHSEFNPVLAALPHSITINMAGSYLIGSITYLPRQDGGNNGNIGQHIIQTRYIYPPSESRQIMLTICLVPTEMPSPR